jgi:hypothetical protein
MRPLFAGMRADPFEIHRYPSRKVSALTASLHGTGAVTSAWGTVAGRPKFVPSSRMANPPAPSLTLL